MWIFLGGARNRWGLCTNYSSSRCRCKQQGCLFLISTYLDVWAAKSFVLRLYFLNDFNFVEICLANWASKSWSLPSWTSKTYGSLVLQSFDSFWYEYPWRVFCSTQTCHRMPSSSGNVFLCTNTFAFNFFVSMFDFRLWIYFRTWPSRPQLRNWLLRIFMVMHGILSIFSEAINFIFLLLCSLRLSRVPLI